MNAARDMHSETSTETFLCPYLHSTITRHSCADRHRHYAAKGYGTLAKVDRLGVASCACRTCPIGREHARGKRPDVQLVQVVARPGLRRSRIPRCLGCGDPITRQRLGSSRSLFCSRVCESAVEELRSKDDASQLPDRF